jgi:hypothetical protein
MSFESIAKVKGAGTSSKELKYTFLDEHPHEGVNYYRLQQTDFDGNYTYSSIITVDVNQNIITSVFPNPTNGPFTLQLNEVSQSPVLIIVRDILGREVFYTVVTITDKVRIITLTPETNVPSGIYYVIASSDDKICKQKLLIIK